MPRRMSCAMTVDAVERQNKLVTRRDPETWSTLKPGDRLTLIEKGMGLPKGARQRVLAEVEVTSNRIETLADLTNTEVRLEGFPDMGIVEFARWWAEGHGYPKGLHIDLLVAVECRRIAWRYLDDRFGPYADPARW